MKLPQIKLLILTLGTSLFALGAQGQQIGIEFYRNSNSATPVAPTETAGFLPQMNFNVNTGNSTAQTLNNSAGILTTATLGVNYGGYFSSGSFTNPGDLHLFSSNLNNGSLASGAAITLAAVPFTTYNVYVYASSDNNSAGDYCTYALTPLGGTTQYRSLQIMPSPSTYVLSNSTFNGTGVPPTGIQMADYVVFTGLTTPNFTLQFGGLNSSGGIFNAGLNGIQIQNAGVLGVPEPSTWAMATVGLGLLGWSLRVRRANRA